MRLTSGLGSVLEHAVSGRSRCRVCGQSIARDTPRFGRSDLLRDRYVWLHPSCVARRPLLGERLALTELLDAWRRSGQSFDAELARLEQRLGTQLRRECFESISRPQDRVRSAVEDLVKGRREEGAAGLLAVWRSTRHPAIAAVLTELTEVDLLEHPLPSARSKGSGAAVQAWEAALPGPTRAHGLRIRAWATHSRRTVYGHLDTACRQPADPRWTDVVIAWLRTPPFAYAIELWHRAFVLMDRVVDARIPSLARAILTLPEAERHGRFGAARWFIERWLTERANHGFPSVLAPPSPDPAVEALLEKASHALQTSRARVRQHLDVEAALYHRAANGDGSALAVLADTWIEAGDPRGELLQASLDAPIRIADSRWRTRLGPLASVFLRDQLLFERGLPRSGAVVPPRADLEGVLDRYEWASVVALQLRPDARGRTEPRLVTSPHAVRLAQLFLGDVELLPDLVAVLQRALDDGQPLVAPVERLVLEGAIRSAHLPPAATLTGVLPRLQTLIVRDRRSEQALKRRYPTLRVTITS